MKTRIISALVALIIFIPVLLLGGLTFDLAIFVLACLSLREWMNAKKENKKIPVIMQIFGYLSLGLLVISSIGQTMYLMEIDSRIIVSVVLIILSPVVFYQNKDSYSVRDAFSLLGVTIFLGLTFALAIRIRFTDLNWLIYLLLITTMSDTFAYVTGILIGKHPMAPNVSPKKTWEGFAGGIFFGVLISTVFYINVINPEVNLIFVIAMTLFLTILGQLGDLFFSCIKRYYGKKDFSNIMPGHGGILDRLDSIIYVVLGFTLFLTFI